MPRPGARQNTASRIALGQAAAPSGGSGCLSGFMLPPLAVLFVGLLLVAFSGRLSPSTQAASAESAFAKNAPAKELAPLFTPEVQFWSGRILAWAAETDLEPNLVATVMQIESCGDPRARSRAGALGLFQVMPYHFDGADDPYDPETNARRGLAYLKRSLEKAVGDSRLALAGYNGGISVIGRAEFTWAAETIRYAYWGSGIYQDALNGAAESPRLQEWLSAGGASLCTKARQRLGIP